MLLDGGQATYDMPTVLHDLPPREVADKLVFRYFNSAENSIGMYTVAHVSLNADEILSSYSSRADL